MVIERSIGDVKGLKIYYEGSGIPSKRHEIIGIEYINSDGNKKSTGDIDKMKVPDRRE